MEGLGAMIEFFVPGVPVPQGRPRFSTRGGYPRAYDDKKSRAWKDAITLAAKTHKVRLMEGPIEVFLTFHMPRPKGIPKNVFWHSKRPDLDNLVKAVLDGLQGHAFKDDGQIAMLVAEKKYREPVGVHISRQEVPYGK